MVNSLLILLSVNCRTIRDVVNVVFKHVINVYLLDSAKCTSTPLIQLKLVKLVATVDLNVLNLEVQTLRNLLEGNVHAVTLQDVLKSVLNKNLQFFFFFFDLAGSLLRIHAWRTSVDYFWQPSDAVCLELMKEF